MHIPNSISYWLSHYGSFALFGLLALGIVGLPIPDETLLIFAGYLLFKGKLHPWSAIPAAITGGMFGISLSYLLGRTAGSFLVKKIEQWLRINDEKLARVHAWFKRIDRWALLVGYFIPGVRHLTGYVAGLTELPYCDFALFAYSGAVLWASTFLAIGYFVHPK